MAFDLHLLFSQAVRFIPMQFDPPYPNTGKLDYCNTFERAL
jgi:hypothetical protein